MSNQRPIDDPLSNALAMLVRYGNEMARLERRVKNIEASNERLSKALKKIKAQEVAK